MHSLRRAASVQPISQMGKSQCHMVKPLEWRDTACKSRLWDSRAWALSPAAHGLPSVVPSPALPLLGAVALVSLGASLTPSGGAWDGFLSVTGTWLPAENSTYAHVPSALRDLAQRLRGLCSPHTRHSLNHVMRVSVLHGRVTLRSVRASCTHLTDQKTEAQSASVSCPRSR